MEKTLIVITGGPGTGKSYMTAQVLDAIKGLTVLSYDAIKEKNFDRFGYDNNAQKDRLNAFGLEEFYLEIQKHMWLSENILIEYPFYQRHKGPLQDLVCAYDYRAVTILLYGDLKTIYDRGVSRDKQDNRHPGHLTSRYHIEDYSPETLVRDAGITYEQFCRMHEEKDYDIGLGRTVKVDVTDIPAIPYQEVLEEVKRIIHE